MSSPSLSLTYSSKSKNKKIYTVYKEGVGEGKCVSVRLVGLEKQICNRKIKNRINNFLRKLKFLNILKGVYKD